MRHRRPDPEIDDAPGPPVHHSMRARDDRPPEPVDPAHRAAVLEGLDQTRRGEVASDEEIDAIYRRAGL